MFLVFAVLHKVKDDVPQLTDTVPVRTGTGMHAFLSWICVLPSRRFFGFFWLSRATVCCYDENIINIINIDSVPVVQQ